VKPNFGVPETLKNSIPFAHPGFFSACSLFWKLRRETADLLSGVLHHHFPSANGAPYLSPRLTGRAECALRQHLRLRPRGINPTATMSLMQRQPVKG
jgi:hypothetical protein